MLISCVFLYKVRSAGIKLQYNTYIYPDSKKGKLLKRLMELSLYYLQIKFDLNCIKVAQVGAALINKTQKECYL